MIGQRLGPSEIVALIGKGDMAEVYAQHDIIQASLQLAAARLLKQEAGASEAFAELRKALTGLEETKRKIARGRTVDNERNPTAKTNNRPHS